MNQATNNIYISIANIIGYYAIPLVSLIGIMLNIFLSIFLKSKKLKHSFYKYIFVKTMIDIFVCIFGAIYYKSICIECGPFTYQHLFHRWYIIMVNIRILFLMSSISEVYIILNRYLMLKNIRNCLYDVKLSYYLLFIILVPTIIMLPTYSAVEISRIGESEFYELNFTNIGKTVYFRIYLLAVIIPDALLPVITLTVMSLLTIRAYNNRLGNQAEFMTTSAERLKKLEKRHTRITIILTILFAISRTFDTISAIFIRLEGYEIVSADILNMVRQITLMISFSMHSLSNTFIIVPMDKNLKDLIKNFFKTLKVILFTLKLLEIFI